MFVNIAATTCSEKKRSYDLHFELSFFSDCKLLNQGNYTKNVLLYVN